MNLGWKKYAWFYASLMHEATANMSSYMQQASHFQKTVICDISFQPLVLTISLLSFLQWFLSPKSRNINKCPIQGWSFHSLLNLALWANICLFIYAKRSLYDEDCEPQWTNHIQVNVTHATGYPIFVLSRMVKTHDCGCSNWKVEYMNLLSTSLCLTQTQFCFSSYSIPNQVMLNDIWRHF